MKNYSGTRQNLSKYRKLAKSENWSKSKMRSYFKKSNKENLCIWSTKRSMNKNSNRKSLQNKRRHWRISGTSSTRFPQAVSKKPSVSMRSITSWWSKMKKPRLPKREKKRSLSSKNILDRWNLSLRRPLTDCSQATYRHKLQYLSLLMELQEKSKAVSSVTDTYKRLNRRIEQSKSW